MALELISIEDLERERRRFDEQIARSPSIDRFCSSSAWVLSAYEAFSPDYKTWIGRDDQGAGYVALVESYHERLGRFRQPLEASWCLANPFAGADQARLVQSFAKACLAGHRDWDLLFLSGIKRDGTLYHSLIEHFSGLFFVGVGPPVTRFIASLEGGLDGFLSRRAPKMRANLRRIDRRASEQGLTPVYYNAQDGELDWQALYERILAVERQSWKGLSGTGIIDVPMQQFYRSMLPRLNAQGALRVMFIERDGQDIAFIFGAVFDGQYRGLQVSFRDEDRHHSPGNLAQLWMIRWLCEQGVARYDLGSELEYKRTWAEEAMETISLVIRPW